MEEKKPITPRSKEFRSQNAVQAHRGKSLVNERNDRQRATNRVTPQYRNVFTTRDDSSSSEIHGDALVPVKNAINDDRKNKRYSRPTSNMNTNNRRMTGNVNIYICSETNNPANPQERNKRRSKVQSSTEASSDVTSEQSNSRCISASSISSCKLLNSIREKRKRLHAKQLTFVEQENDGMNDNSDNGNSNVNTASDNNPHDSENTSRTTCGKESVSESTSKERLDDEAAVTTSHVDDQCQTAPSKDSTRDGCCCRDPSSTDLPRTPRFDDESGARPRSWTTIYPSETRNATTDVCDGFSNEVYVARGNHERRNARKNDRYATCDAMTDDGSGSWLPRSIYTDCTKNDSDWECFGCRYRNERLRLMLNRSDVWCKQAGYNYKREPPPAESYRREPAMRRWSTCSCITEEEEDIRCARIGREEREVEEPCDHVECPAKVTVCRAPCGALIETTCEAPLKNAREQTPERENSLECPRYVTTCQVMLLENSEQASKVTGELCRDEFVSGEPPRVATICVQPEQITICEKRALANSREPAPKETPKVAEIPVDSNFVSRDGDKEVESVRLNDAKDKLVRENTDTLNQQRKENAAVVVQADGKNNSVRPDNNLTRVDKPAKSIAQTRANASNERSRNATVPVGESNGDSKPRNVYYPANLARPPNFRNPPNFIPSHNPRERLTLPIGRRAVTSMRLASVNQVTKDVQRRNETSNKNNQSTDEKVHEENLKGNEEAPEEKPRETIFQRSVKRMMDIIKHYRTQAKERMEARKLEAKQDIIEAEAEKIDEEKNDEDEPVVEPTEPIADFIPLPEEDKPPEKPVPKLVRIIEERRLHHLHATANVTPEEPEVKPEESEVKPEEPEVEPEEPEVIPEEPEVVPEEPEVVPEEPEVVPEEPEVVPEEPEVVPEEPEVVPEEPEVEPEVAEVVVSIPEEIPKLPEEVIPEEEAIPEEEPIPEEEVIPEKEVIPEEEAIPEVEVIEKPVVTEEELLVPKIDKVEDVEVVEKDIVIDMPEIVLDEEEVVPIEDAIYVPCPGKVVVEEEPRIVTCMCDVPLAFEYTTCGEVLVPCPQKKLEVGLTRYELAACKCKLHVVQPNICSRSMAKCTKRAKDDCARRMSNGLEARKDCARCHSSVDQCTCGLTQHLKSCLKCLKSDQPKFRNMSPQRDGQHVCLNCYRRREECICVRETAMRYQPHEDCRCKCAARNNYSRTIERNDRRRRSSARCGLYEQPREQSWHSTFGLMERRRKGSCGCKKAMICVYCDNPRDKCECRAPIGKCSRCALSSDVCECRNETTTAPDDARVPDAADEESANNSRTIRVSSWRPKREIRRYFARDPVDVRSTDSAEECRYCDRCDWQPPEELPYQRLNVFSDVMNELQRKMSESVYCTLCRRHPCRCGSLEQDGRADGRRAKGNARWPEADKPAGSKRSTSKSPRKTSPNNGCNRCNSGGEKQRGNASGGERSTPRSPIRRAGCVCKLSPCRCRRARSSATQPRRPLAKCYYCKSLPCTCADSLDRGEGENALAELTARGIRKDK